MALDPYEVVGPHWTVTASVVVHSSSTYTLFVVTAWRYGFMPLTMAAEHTEPAKTTAANTIIAMAQDRAKLVFMALIPPTVISLALLVGYGYSQCASMPGGARPGSASVKRPDADGPRIGSSPPFAIINRFVAQFIVINLTDTRASVALLTPRLRPDGGASA